LDEKKLEDLRELLGALKWAPRIKRTKRSFVPKTIDEIIEAWPEDMRELIRETHGPEWAGAGVASLELSDVAREMLSIANDVRGRRPRSGRGRPPSDEVRRARAVADLAAFFYEQQTGCEATRKNPSPATPKKPRASTKDRYHTDYVALVREIFEILGIRSSVKNVTKDVIEARHPDETRERKREKAWKPIVIGDPPDDVELDPSTWPRIFLRRSK
jgi:hypothetical protein